MSCHITDICLDTPTVLLHCQGMTAYDTVDGLIPLTNLTVSSSNSQVAVSVAKPLPCAATVYTVCQVLTVCIFTHMATTIIKAARIIFSMGCTELCQQHVLLEKAKQQVQMWMAALALVRKRAKHSCAQYFDIPTCTHRHHSHRFGGG
jgi:hypothetical protein